MSGGDDVPAGNALVVREPPETMLPASSAAALGVGLEQMELPSKLVVTRGPGFFELSWRWKEQVSRDLFFGPVFASLGSMSGIANLAKTSPVAALLALVLLASVVGGMALAYNKNVMRVRVSQGALALSSGPIGGRAREIVAEDVADVVAAPPKRPRKQGDGWSVHVLYKAENGKRPRKPRAIVGALMKREQAEQIASLIRIALEGESGEP